MADEKSGEGPKETRPIVDRRPRPAGGERDAAATPGPETPPPTPTGAYGGPPPPQAIPQSPFGSGPGPGPGPGADRREKLAHDGRFGEIFVIFLVNLLLTLITLGIYRFWGKTRIRKYVWSHTSLRGERLEYTGTGLELFLGFLFAVLVFGTPTVLIYVWIFSSPPDPVTMLVVVLILYLVIIPLFFFIYYVAIFAAYRYRISRTSWFGIRGGMEGSAWKYGFLGFGLGILNFLSMGWTKPWADSVVFKYRLSRTWFGSRKFDSTLECTGMYGPFALAWVGSFLAGVVAFGIFGVLYFDVFVEMSRRRNPPPADVFNIQLALTLAYLTPILVFQLLVPWYKAALVRNIANTLSAGDVRFETHIKGSEMFKLLVPNFLLLLFTLGLAYPYVVLRTARYVANHLEIVGNVDVATVQQSEIAAPWYGEGIMEFLGVGMI